MRRCLLVLPLLLLPACGDDEPPVSRAAPAPSASASASPSAAPAADPTPTPEPTQPPRSPAGDRDVPAFPGDVDGDGEPDVVTVDEATSTVTVELSGEGRTVSSGFSTDTPPVVAGAEDVDRDGRAEVFVRTARGSSTTFLTPFRYDGEVLAPLTVDGQQAVLGIGGSATHGEGFSCTDDGQLVVRSALRQDDSSWDISTTTYEVQGHVLTGVDATNEASVPEDDPRVGGSYLVDCRSVGEGE